MRSQYRRLPAPLAIFKGLRPSAKRYVSELDYERLRALKLLSETGSDVTAAVSQIASISERQFVNLQHEARTGVRRSREKVERLRLEGILEYFTPASRKRASTARRHNQLRRILGERATAGDVRVLEKWRQDRSSLTKRERVKFDALFAKFSRSVVLEALYFAEYQDDS